MLREVFARTKLPSRRRAWLCCRCLCSVCVGRARVNRTGHQRHSKYYDIVWIGADPPWGLRVRCGTVCCGHCGFSVSRKPLPAPISVPEIAQRRGMSSTLWRDRVADIHKDYPHTRASLQRFSPVIYSRSLATTTGFLRYCDQWLPPTQAAGTIWISVASGLLQPQLSILSTLQLRRRSSSHGLKVGGLSQSCIPSPLLLLTHAKLLKPYKMPHPIPASFYDILPNDSLHLSYTNQVEDQADRGFGESCHFPLTGGELPSLYPTYNEIPPFQTPVSLPSTFSSSVASSTSGESPWAQSPSTLSDSLSSQLILEPETEESKVQPAATQRGKRSGKRSGKRRSNPVGSVSEIERPAGTGYAAMFVRPF